MLNHIGIFSHMEGHLMKNGNKSAHTNCFFWFVVLAQGMVLIDLFCRSPLNLLVKYNPITILPLLLILYDVLPGLLTGVFLFLAVRHYRETPMKSKSLSGILVISINVVILAAAFYTLKIEMLRHPLIFVMIGFGIVTLIFSGNRK